MKGEMDYTIILLSEHLVQYVETSKHKAAALNMFSHFKKITSPIMCLYIMPCQILTIE